MTAESRKRNITPETVLRPSVLYFALRMEEKLRKHDKDRGVSGWNGYTDPDEQLYLFNRLKEEVAECEEELISSWEFVKKHPEEHLLKTSSEVIDIANFAMMMYTAWGTNEHSIRMAAWLFGELSRKGDAR